MKTYTKSTQSTVSLYDINKRPMDDCSDDDDIVEQNDDSKMEPKSESQSADDAGPSGLCLSVVKTNAAAKGWISPRIFMNVIDVKYDELTQEHYTVGTFIPDEMLDKEMKDTLRVKEDDLNNLVIGRNLSLHLRAKRVENTVYSKVVYVLQANNGGWLPQWAVEMGMVDQHMIAIIKRMTQWVLQRQDVQESADNNGSGKMDVEADSKSTIPVEAD